MSGRRSAGKNSALLGIKGIKEQRVWPSNHGKMGAVQGEQNATRNRHSPRLTVVCRCGKTKGMPGAGGKGSQTKGQVGAVEDRSSLTRRDTTAASGVASAGDLKHHRSGWIQNTRWICRAASLIARPGRSH